MFYGLKTETNRAKTGIPAALEIRWESVLMMMMMMMILRVVTLQSDCLFFFFFVFPFLSRDLVLVMSSVRTVVC